MQLVVHVPPYQVTGGQSRCQCMLLTSKHSHTVCPMLWVPCIWRMSRHEKHSLMVDSTPCRPKKFAALGTPVLKFSLWLDTYKNHRYQIRAIFTSDLIGLQSQNVHNKIRIRNFFLFSLKEPYSRG